MPRSRSHSIPPAVSHRLLVIDDSLTIRKLVEISLRGRGFTVDYAATGREGVERALHERPDLILLDFVLPDIKGVEVCRQLAQHASTASCPIIILTGKQAQLRELFKDLRSVVDYVSKPFTPEDIVARIERVLGQLVAKPTAAAKASAATSTAASFRFTLFARLHAGLVQIPEWMRELGDEEPAHFFSTRLFNEARVVELFEALVPIYKQTLRQRGRDPEVDLSGSFELLPPPRLLELLAEAGKTGELLAQHDERTTRVFVRSGELILATSNDPAHFLGALALEGVAAEVLDKATGEQRASGKPLPVSLASAGALAGADVTSLVHAEGARVLAALLASTSGTFTWRRRQLPSYVDTHARPLSPLGLELERLRGDAHLEPLAPQVVCDRAPQFSERVRKLALDVVETKLLALVDGVGSAEELAAESKLAPELVTRVLARLCAIGLLAPRAPARATGRLGPMTAPRVSLARRQVMVLEPDEPGFRRPLARRLEARKPAFELLTVEDEDEAVAAMLRDRPALVLINATAFPGVTLQSAREIAARPELSRTRLIAVLDAPEPAHAERLTAAGCDAVLTKPVHILEIERLLVGEPGSLDATRTDSREVH